MQTPRYIALSVVALAIGAAPAGAAPDPALVGAVNAERSKRGLPHLKPSPSLRRSARRYARWLLRRDAFGHQARIRASWERFDLVGETLAFTNGPDPGSATVVGWWLSSPSHRRVVLTRRMHRVGAGKARGWFRGRRATIRVLHVGRPR